MTIPVYVVDDDGPLRDSMVALLSMDPALSVTAYASGAEFFDAVDGGAAPGVVLLDLLMPGLSGFEVLNELAQRRSAFKVIVITAHGDTRQAVRAARAGALDFLEKPFDWSDLVEAIVQVSHVRENVVQPAMRSKLSKLTHREKQVLSHLLKGCMNKQIAYELDMSVRTVEVHRSHIMRKIGVTNQVDMIRRLLTSGDIVTNPQQDHFSLIDD